MAARVDIVGSLLRPPWFKDARERYAAGNISAAEFKRVEDDAVDEAVKLQEEAGLAVVTDSEMRRESFQSQLAEAVEGFGEPSIEAYLWGDWRGGEGVGDKFIARPEDLGVVGKLRRRRHLSVEEFVYLRARTTRTPKATLPSPSLFANFWSPETSKEAYLTLDAPQYPLLLEEKIRRFYEERGWDLSRWLSRSIELDNHVIGDHPGVTFGFHLCRGNQRSRWLASGSYEMLARGIFGGIGVDRLLLEYDDERSGTIEPLHHVPEDKTVVLGLVTTKTPYRETPEELEARVREATRYYPLEKLAISPQCGFSTSIIGNAIIVEDEQHKLRTLVETAERIWG